MRDYPGHALVHLLAWVWAWGMGLPAHAWWLISMPYLVLGVACVVVEVLDAEATRLVEHWTGEADPFGDEAGRPRP